MSKNVFDANDSMIVKVYYEQDFEGFVGDFIDSYFVQDGERTLVYLDGSLRVFNGTYYAPVSNPNLTFDELVRQYVRELSLVDRKRRAVLTPTSPSFYANFYKTLERLCMLTEDEAELFRNPDTDLVFGKTKVFRISTGQFESYSHKFRNLYTLDFDVADDDQEPKVWTEFFDAAQMDDKQRLSWWRQRAVVVMRDRRHNRIFYNFGNPRSGKGTTTSIDTAFFGKNCAAAVPYGVGSNAHLSSVIIGKSLLTINDVKFDKRTSTSLIRFLLNVIGCDPITINPKYKAPFDYYPEANLEITSNEIPAFKGNLSGMEDKFVFNVFHRDENMPVDLTLRDRMLETMPHIIRKAVKMYRETVESNYAFDTDQGKAVREQFVESASGVRRFADEDCELSERYNDSSLAMYRSFLKYSHEHGESRISMAQFVKELRTCFLGKIDHKRITVNGKKITVLTGIHRIGQGDTVNDPTPKPPRSVVGISFTNADIEESDDDVPI